MHCHKTNKHTHTHTHTDRDRATPFNKMTAGVKPVVLSKFDMADDKSPTSCFVLLRNKS